MRECIRFRDLELWVSLKGPCVRGEEVAWGTLISPAKSAERYLGIVQSLFNVA